MTAQPPSSNKPFILVVDDNPKNIIAIKTVLSDLPIIIHSATSGEEALKSVLRHKYAVIYLDIQMPDMDGYEVSQHISENKQTANTPIVMVTAIYSDEMNIKKGYEHGAIDYLNKPIDPNILIAKTKIFIKLFEQQQQLSEAVYQLDKLANQDTLTGLPNRYHFNTRIQQVLSESLRNNLNFSVLLLDLDEFKSINDNLGHDVGDRLLQVLSERFKANLRSSDMLARLGGDEFVILLDKIKTTTFSAKIAEKMLSLLAKPIDIDNHQINISCSIGIATYPVAGDNINELMKSADIALYRSKELGKNTFQFFTDELNKKASRKIKIETIIKSAVSHNKIQFYYQPRVDIRSHQILGVEMLARLHDDDLGAISPVEFIKIAEEFGFIKNLGDYLLKNAFTQYKLLSEKAPKKIKYSINLSPFQFLNHDFIAYLNNLIQEMHLDVTNLEFELTESIFRGDDKVLESLLSTVNNMGIHFAIDDFGTGYSSLSRLKTFPIHTLKIDKSFVNDILTDQSDLAIVEAIIALGKALNLEIIAEGVEKKEQAELLLDKGCSMAQGFYYSKPLPFDETVALLKSNKLTLK